jgi:hypothetical protein
MCAIKASFAGGDGISYKPCLLTSRWPLKTRAKRSQQRSCGYLRQRGLGGHVTGMLPADSLASALTKLYRIQKGFLLFIRINVRPFTFIAQQRARIQFSYSMIS